MALVTLLIQLASSTCIGLNLYFLWKLYNARLPFWRPNKIPTCMAHASRLKARDLTSTTIASTAIPDTGLRPNAFVPGRWFVGPDREHYPWTKGAGRSFEYGQTLVMLDTRVTLVLVVREFDIRDGYKECIGENRGGVDEVKDLDGEKWHQVGKGSSAHPSDGSPCRVVRRVES